MAVSSSAWGLVEADDAIGSWHARFFDHRQFRSGYLAVSSNWSAAELIQ
jgi:hypothetical protein